MPPVSFEEVESFLVKFAVLAATAISIFKFLKHKLKE
jgi:hypothetical protein